MESLLVPAQPNLLPLATMPDETTSTDELHASDKTVQDILSVTLEPTKAHAEDVLQTISNNIT